MTSNSKKERESPNFSVKQLRQLLESDEYLKPCFTLGYIHIIEKSGDNPIWIDFTLKDTVRQYIRNRVDALLAGEGDEQMEREIKKWDDLKQLDRIFAEIAAREGFEAGDTIMMELEAEEMGLAQDIDPRDMHAQLTMQARTYSGAE